MVNLETLDTLIALVVILLVLSLSVQSIQSAIEKFFRIKSYQIEQSLIHLIYYSLNKDARVTTQNLLGRRRVSNTSLPQKIETLAGGLLMTLLLSVGARFWQDTLESLFGLKNFLRKQGKKES